MQAKSTTEMRPAPFAPDQQQGVGHSAPTAGVKAGEASSLDSGGLRPLAIAGPRAPARPLRDLIDVARLGYIYGLPAYEVARLRYRALSRPRRGELLRLNTFTHARTLSTPKTGNVTAVNADTLLSRAWIDLSRGPLVVHVPDTRNRYYSLALMDFFTNNFAVLGRRTTGTAARDFFLAGPRWDGEAPPGMTAIRSPTNAVWMLARFLVDGPADIPAVQALQDQLALSPAPGYREDASGSPDPLSLPVLPLERGKLLRFFDVLNAVLTENPPPGQDKAVLERLRTIGVGPALRFDRRKFTEPQLGALRQGLASARNTIRAQVAFRTSAPERVLARRWPSDLLLAQLRGPAEQLSAQRERAKRLGWSGPADKVGNFGTDYLLRAQCALAGLGLLPREEAMYFSTATDCTGAALSGESKYVLRFGSADLPPVDAFWSLTIYRQDENHRRWLVPNSINRYSIGSRNSDLRFDGDGSLRILIQYDPPGAAEENWLPAPEGPFLLTLRAYHPRRELLEGRYVIPEVRCR